MRAVYRLSQNIPSFEFFGWLVMVKARGATEIAFDLSNPKLRKKFTDFGFENVMNRFRSIVEPGPALARLPSRFVDGSVTGEVNASSIDLVPWGRAGNSFDRLESVKPPVPCGYTVTIRDNALGGARGRDSNQEAWRKFADEIGALVIEDYHVKPIHLHDRVALYAGAKMNFGVCNGPVHAISLMRYPVIMLVNSVSAQNSQIKCGNPFGQQYPWMLPNQKLVWIKDTYDNLMRIFEENRC